MCGGQRSLSNGLLSGKKKDNKLDVSCCRGEWNEFLFLCVAGTVASTGQRRATRSKRGLLELAGAIKCSTGRSAFAYMMYGCYCGLGGRGWPKDRVDWWVRHLLQDGPRAASPRDSHFLPAVSFYKGTAVLGGGQEGEALTKWRTIWFKIGLEKEFHTRNLTVASF